MIGRLDTATVIVAGSFFREALEEGAEEMFLEGSTAEEEEEE